MKLKEILNKIIQNNYLIEGVDDPGILKCIFIKTKKIMARKKTKKETLCKNY